LRILLKLIHVTKWNGSQYIKWLCLHRAFHREELFNPILPQLWPQPSWTLKAYHLRAALTVLKDPPLSFQVSLRNINLLIYTLHKTEFLWTKDWVWITAVFPSQCLVQRRPSINVKCMEGWTGEWTSHGGRELNPKPQRDTLLWCWLGICLHYGPPRHCSASEAKLTYMKTIENNFHRLENKIKSQYRVFM
jgi:hypothetical protein